MVGSCGSVHFVGLGVGSIRLGYELSTRSNLRVLFAFDPMEDLLLVDGEGEEVPFSEMEVGGKYHILSAEDLRDDCPYSMDRDQMSDEMIRKAEQDQHCRLLKMAEARFTFIERHYTRKHPEIFQFQKEHLDIDFLTSFESEDKNSLLHFLTKETDGTNLLSFPSFFSHTYCNKLMEEVESFESSGLPVSRPNSMNNYGMILDEIGFSSFFEELRAQYISPLSALLFPNSLKPLTSHHAFIVKYKLGEDIDLAFHYDMSELTINVCLGKVFTGGSLYFKGIIDEPDTHTEQYEYFHSKGKALMHVGKHRHGAHPITSGERYNLIVWWQSVHQTSSTSSLQEMAESSFWLRWANRELINRGVVAHTIPKDFANGSLLLHLIEMADASLFGFIDGHVLYPHTEKDTKTNIELLKNFVGAEKVSTEKLIIAGGCIEVLKYVSMLNVTLVAPPLRRFAPIRQKLLSYLSDDLNEYISDINVCVQGPLLHKLLSIFLSCHDPTLDIFELYQLFEKKSNLPLLLKYEDLGSDQLSEEAKLLFLLQFYRSDSPLMVKREHHTYLWKEENEKTNKLLGKLNGRNFLICSQLCDCRSLATGLMQKHPNSKSDIDTILSCLSAIEETISTSSEEIQLTLLQSLSCFAKRIQKQEKNIEESMRMQSTLKEQMAVIAARYKREMVQLSNNALSLQDRQVVMQNYIVEQQEQMEYIQHITKEMAERITESQNEEYHDIIKHSILSTLRQQSQIIGEQNQFMEDEDMAHLNFDELLTKLEGNLQSEDQSELQLLHLQHYGHLHEIIHSQRQKIALLQQPSEREAKSAAPSHSPQIPTPSPSPSPTTVKPTPPILFSQQQQKIQIDNERKSLVEYLHSLRHELEQTKHKS